MRKTVTLLSLAVSMAACGQINKTIVRAHAYYVIPTPGTIMVDENRKEMPPPRTKNYTVYLEIKGQVPQWAKAWADGRSFTLTAVPFASGSVIVGKRAVDEKTVVLEASKQNALLQLELAPDEKAQPAPQKIGNHAVLLYGKLRGKSFYYKIASATELASPEYQ